MIIAGDIGGTKTNVALFETDGRTLGRMAVRDSFPSNGYPSLEAILGEFIEANRPETVTHACFGVAGPVVGGRVETTNLAWDVSARRVADTLDIPHVSLLNDLEAIAHGIEALDETHLYTLHEGGGRRDGHRALIAAGTGLGMAGIFWDGRRYRPMSSEGGHIDFAPRDDREAELLRYMRGRLGGRVSYERLLSGPGLFNIYTFLRDTNFAEEPDWLAEEIRAGDPSAAVSKAGLAGTSALAAEALDMFVEIYGSMAGNLALMLKPVGGVFVGGGIAPKILEKIKAGTFMSAYRDKGRMSYLVETMPVYIILDDLTPLYGAGLYAINADA